MINKSILILNILLVLTSSCPCPSKPTEEPFRYNFIPKSEGNLTDVIIDGQNYGKPIVIYPLIFLNATFPVSLDKYNRTLTVDCPEGYRSLQETDYIALLSSLGDSAYETLTKVDGLNMKADRYYMTTTAVNKENSLQTLGFVGLTFEENTVSKKTIENSEIDKMVGQCVQDTLIKFNGLEKDISTTFPRKFSIDASNLKKSYVIVDQEYSRPFQSVLYYPEEGCHTVEAWGINLLNHNLYTCREIYSKYFWGSDVESSFTLSDFTKKALKAEVNMNDYLYDFRSTAPLVPGFNYHYYSIYTSSSDNHLHLIHGKDFSSSDIDDQDLKIEGHPLDIIEIDDRIVFYARSTENTGYSFLIGLEKETLEIKFNLTITEAYSEKTNYSLPPNGKLSYGKGRVALIFGYENKWGRTSAFITVDKNGENLKYGWKDQRTAFSFHYSHFYDKRYFITASYYQSKITISVVDVEAKGDYYNYETGTVDDYKHYHYEITGKNTELTFAGIVEIDNSFAIIYSSQEYSKNAKIIMDFFELKKENIVLQKTKIIDEEISGNIKATRAVKYGKNILLSYMSQSSSYFRSDKKTEIENKSDIFYSLINSEGEYVITPIKSNEKNMNFDDDLREMRDGSLIWTKVNDNQEINFIGLPRPRISVTQ